MMLKCSRCGKILETPDGTSISGIRLSYCELTDDNKDLVDLSRKLWGKYLPDGETKVDYDFCYECWLDSLMGVK